MAHRHPTKLNAEHVTHPAARRLLRAELARCADCREEADSAALDDIAPDGVFASLLRGFALARAEQWRNRHTRYPINVYDLAPPDEGRRMAIPTREVARLCVVEGRAGNNVTIQDALVEFSMLGDSDQARVLDDVIDAILEEEG
jgi:hypothetical protein